MVSLYMRSSRRLLVRMLRVQYVLNLVFMSAFRIAAGAANWRSPLPLLILRGLRKIARQNPVVETAIIIALAIQRHASVNTSRI